MNKNTKAFTFIELIISITIFTILMGIAFGIFPFITGTIKKLGNEHSLLKSSIKIKEELIFNNKNIAFYSYSTINSLVQTQYGFENTYRKNIKEIIINTLKDSYSLTDYKIDQPDVCILPYTTDQYFNEGELSILRDEYLLDKCNNLINTSEFDEQYKIMSVIDKKNLLVNIYFPYKSSLHKITTSLITDLSDDNIIYTKKSSGKVKLRIYDGFLINKFTGNSYNYCKKNDSLSGECSFTDFLYTLGKSGNLYIDMYKLTTNGEEIHIKSSYILKTLYSLNY